MNQDHLFYARMTGAYGSVHCGGTNIVTGEFSRIDVITATVFHTLTNTLDTTADFDVAATGTLAFSTGALTAGDTITVAGQAFTAVAENATPTAVQFKIGTSYATAAANAMAAINAHAATAAQVTVTSAVVASTVVLTVTAVAPGAAGNNLTIAKSAANVAVLPVDGSLDGGVTQERATAPTYPANFTLYGNFTTIKLTSGDVIAYHANRQ